MLRHRRTALVKNAPLFWRPAPDATTKPPSLDRVFDDRRRSQRASHRHVGSDRRAALTATWPLTRAATAGSSMTPTFPTRIPTRPHPVPPRPCSPRQPPPPPTIPAGLHLVRCDGDDLDPGAEPPHRDRSTIGLRTARPSCAVRRLMTPGTSRLTLTLTQCQHVGRARSGHLGD